jgi:hypothetical protein
MNFKLNIPESLNEVTLSQYQKWVKIIDEEKISTFFQQKMIEIFCSADLKKILQMKVKDVDEVTSNIDNLFNEKPLFVPTFKLGEVEFGFIPQLDEMTFGEYIDLDNYLTDWETMNKAMSVLFRPILHKRKGKYVIEDYKGSDTYNLSEMPLNVVMGALVFFCNLRNELQKHILNYLKTQEEVEIPQGLKDSLKNGIGINPYIPYHREILEN